MSKSFLTIFAIILVLPAAWLPIATSRAGEPAQVMLGKIPDSAEIVFHQNGDIYAPTSDFPWRMALGTERRIKDSARMPNWIPAASSNISNLNGLIPRDGGRRSRSPKPCGEPSPPPQTAPPAPLPAPIQISLPSRPHAVTLTQAVPRRGLIAFQLKDHNGKMQVFTINPDGRGKKQTDICRNKRTSPLVT